MKLYHLLHEHGEGFTSYFFYSSKKIKTGVFFGSKRNLTKILRELEIEFFPEFETISINDVNSDYIPTI